MKFTDLGIDGFGVWSGLEVRELGPGLNVFYGPNEAGKTTLLQFVRAVLYGFSLERRRRYLPPRAWRARRRLAGRRDGRGTFDITAILAIRFAAGRSDGHGSRRHRARWPAASRSIGRR